jgi:hypothetical protein
MRGNHEASSELDTSITYTVKFIVNSTVHIQGPETIIFAYKLGVHCVPMDIYYIPKLNSNTVSLGFVGRARLRGVDKEWNSVLPRPQAEAACLLTFLNFTAKCRCS